MHEGSILDQVLFPWQVLTDIPFNVNPTLQEYTAIALNVITPEGYVIEPFAISLS